MNDFDDNTEFAKELEALAGELPREVRPEHDLWPGIEQAIHMPARTHRSPWNNVLAQAAAVVLLVAGSSGLTYLAVKNGQSPVVPQVVTTDNLFETVSGEFGTGYTLGNKYLDAREQLEVGLVDKLDTLLPETRDSVVANLNTIRLAINEINEALALEPDNKLLQELLLSNYHEEMSLMVRVDGIANSAMRRNDM